MSILKSRAEAFILYTIKTLGSHVVKKGVFFSSVNEIKREF